MDKIKHITASALITFLAMFLQPFIGILIGLLAGLFKEFVWDLKLGKGTFDAMDIFANVLGVLIGAFLFYVL